MPLTSAPWAPLKWGEDTYPRGVVESGDEEYGVPSAELGTRVWTETPRPSLGPLQASCCELPQHQWAPCWLCCPVPATGSPGCGGHRPFSTDPLCGPGAQLETESGWVGGRLGPGAVGTGSGPTPCHLSAEHVLRLVDCASGAAQDFTGHDDCVQVCRFSPAASLLFTAAHNEILVWEVTGY